VSFHVLVVEDDELLGSSLCRALVASGYSAERSTTLAAARAACTERPPDAVLLDLSLPDGDGVSFSAALHATEPSLPIIMLTARSEEIDVVVGLNSGAVDYVIKPFRLAELLARLEAHLRTATARAHSASSDADGERNISVGDVVVDTASRRCWVADTEVTLRTREFDLLVRLIRDAGKVVRREDLISDVWDEHWYGSTKTLDVHIAHLRRKLSEEPGDASRIASIRGVGYRFEQPE
jgi:DNA-binding response OmpR family regulator